MSHVIRLRAGFEPASPGHEHRRYSSGRITEVNLRAACALHFAYYNLCRVHASLRCTPAMEAKITDHVWDLAELLSGNRSL